MKSKKYGEVKVRKKFYPSLAKEIVEKGEVGVVVTECGISKKTAGIFEEAGITAYQISKEVIKEKLEELENMQTDKNLERE